MYTENLSFYDCCEGKVVKGISEIGPDIMISIFFGDLIIESIDSGDISWLMISSQQYNNLGIFEFVQKK